MMESIRDNIRKNSHKRYTFYKYFMVFNILAFLTGPVLTSIKNRRALLRKKAEFEQYKS